MSSAKRFAPNFPAATLSDEDGIPFGDFEEDEDWSAPKRKAPSQPEEFHDARTQSPLLSDGDILNGSGSDEDDDGTRWKTLPTFAEKASETVKNIWRRKGTVLEALFEKRRCEVYSVDPRNEGLVKAKWASFVLEMLFGVTGATRGVSKNLGGFFKWIDEDLTTQDEFYKAKENFIQTMVEHLHSEAKSTGTLVCTPFHPLPKSCSPLKVNKVSPAHELNLYEAHLATPTFFVIPSKYDKRDRDTYFKKDIATYPSLAEASKAVLTYAAEKLSKTLNRNVQISNYPKMHFHRETELYTWGVTVKTNCTYEGQRPSVVQFLGSLASGKEMAESPLCLTIYRIQPNVMQKGDLAMNVSSSPIWNLQLGNTDYLTVVWKADFSFLLPSDFTYFPEAVEDLSVTTTTTVSLKGKKFV
ncbi:hypothetical protein GE061_020290 [Apolygus lucorum]|uniref:Uncharacterized protein n=1 Tax=Apolygus lucorum TaxID=248454 RepID=A0A6A4ITK7_APOLU|nr:hypothetical protein GE061_020290 [Apolygus lucorum]